eukprot:Plantae.Rhodophyta-Purpureofilum_apyrenoidigerum.ctg22328.p1 GENE.Plantae.Rhodophyta-Purpureofilum_apyrenoidigerum.ctg22328~~Plantae.Rhodophyta-Purpureofilum_apyrenoidigerum.ctg22328.p1  ORF type:complete len:558 (-),score=110.14 Plantae.Rhodophyta-Purpureofilum_apyrenoidigerum.ctg22328:1698-3371(-)
MDMPGEAIDYDLDDRHLPSSQVERIPFLEEHKGEDIFSPSSLRANFIPVGAETRNVATAKLSKYSGLFQETPLFSPVFSHLPHVKPDTLIGSSQEKQNLRRKLMRGANILIVQGGYSGKRFIYERLKELGVSVTIMDGPDSVWRQAAEDGLIHQFVEIDFTDYATILERSLDALLDLDTQFDAVTTYFENAVPLAAKIARSLGVETNPVEACEKARSKSLTRQVMKEHGLPVPKFYKITSEDQVVEACEFVGFPAVLKPSFGAASFGVFRVNSLEETENMYKDIMNTLSDRSDASLADLWAQGTEMLLEEYYDGDEFDIDIVLSDGKVVYVKISDNWHCCEPWFQETGTNCPSLYPEDAQKELISLANNTTLALGFLWGVFHVEVKYTSRGPRLIEVNARMGGMSVRQANLTAWGVDLVEEHAMSALKIPLGPPVAREPVAAFAQFAINAPYSGTINSDTWLDHISEDPRCVEVHYCFPKGKMVKGPEEQVPTFLAELRFISDRSSMSELLKSIQQMITKIPPPLTPVDPKKEREEKLYFPDFAFPFVPPKVLEEAQ